MPMFVEHCWLILGKIDAMMMRARMCLPHQSSPCNLALSHASPRQISLQQHAKAKSWFAAPEWRYQLAGADAPFMYMRAS